MEKRDENVGEKKYVKRDEEENEGKPEMKFEEKKRGQSSTVVVVLFRQYSECITAGLEKHNKIPSPKGKRRS